MSRLAATTALDPKGAPTAAANPTRGAWSAVARHPARAVEMQALAVFLLTAVGTLSHLLGQGRSPTDAIADLQVGTVLVVAAIGRDLLAGNRRDRSAADRRDHAVFITLMLLAAAPTVSSCWIGLAVAGAWVAHRGRVHGTAGRLLILLALFLLKERLWSDLIAASVLDFEAALTAAALGLLGTNVGLDQNLILLPDGRTLLLFRDCSMLNIAAPATLTLIGLRHLLWPDAGGLMRRSVSLLTFLFVLNTARLIGMAMSPDSYQFLHEGTGAGLFSAVIVLATVLLAVGRRRS